MKDLFLSLLLNEKPSKVVIIKSHLVIHVNRKGAANTINE
jgi:hypothetical protein